MKNMKQLREQAGLTQIEMAEALGVEQSTVSMWETGNSRPRARLLPQIAKLLGCTIEELYGETPEAV